WRGAGARWAAASAPGPPSAACRSRPSSWPSTGSPTFTVSAATSSCRRASAISPRRWSACCWDWRVWAGGRGPFRGWGVGLAAAGVANLFLGAGQFPWIALTLAVSFGLYGLLRKQVAVDGVVGLTVETGLLLPPALGYLVFQSLTGAPSFGNGRGLDGLL